MSHRFQCMSEVCFEKDYYQVRNCFALKIAFCDITKNLSENEKSLRHYCTCTLIWRISVLISGGALVAYTLLPFSLSLSFFLSLSLSLSLLSLPSLSLSPSFSLSFSLFPSLSLSFPLFPSLSLSLSLSFSFSLSLSLSRYLAIYLSLTCLLAPLLVRTR
jgi:hypothetical protein